MTSERAFVDRRVEDVDIAAAVADTAAETWGSLDPSSYDTG